MQATLTPQDVQAALDQFGMDLHVQHFDQNTATSELAAAAIGCTVGQIAKSICFLIDGVPLLVVASGDQTVDDRKLAARFAVGRKKVKLAKPEECIAIFGYAPGGVPPVGHRTPGIRTLLDLTLHQYERIYAAAGSANDNFGLTPAQLEQITSGAWADVARDAAPE